jgi:hypothetical protein
MTLDAIKINRAPVLTLWATVVAERLGFDREEALTLGRGLAGLTAQSKGQRLGIFHPVEKGEMARAGREGEEFRVALMGREVPAVGTPQGVRAADKGRPMDPASVARYLDQKFGLALPDAWEAMAGLAESYPPEELERRDFALYERFRPDIPAGTTGWGAAGLLDLERLRMLASHG